MTYKSFILSLKKLDFEPYFELQKSLNFKLEHITSCGQKVQHVNTWKDSRAPKFWCDFKSISDRDFNRSNRFAAAVEFPVSGLIKFSAEPEPEIETGSWKPLGFVDKSLLSSSTS